MCRKRKFEWENKCNNRENETEIDLPQLAKALWHSMGHYAVTLIMAAMAFAGTKLITPLYTASVCEQQFHFRRKHAGEPDDQRSAEPC
ncbi:hypothetical protein [Hominenteromicrobium sp.]|uniref:hypothetical protein n=1 Tax=Hominenteromicrobium sp. TaxID=3073581 RepID=UPI003991CB87